MTVPAWRPTPGPSPGPPKSFITENQQGGTEFLRHAKSRLDESLAADPYQTISHSETFATICEELGIEIDFATLPDEFLDMLADPNNGQGDVTEAPDPHATYPP